MSTDDLSHAGTVGVRRAARHNYWPARLRVLRALTKLALGALFLAVFAIGVLRVTRMIGLPDVGDPLGATARAPAAVVQPGAVVDPLAVYAEAGDLLTQLPAASGRWNSRSEPLYVTWTAAAPELRVWVERNREALDEFRRGSELPGIAERTRRHRRLVLPATGARLGELIWLTMMEGDRLEDAGDAEGAWGCYLAALRSTYHRAQHGDENDRALGQRLRAPVAARIDAWSEDPRVRPELLRRALANVLECQATMPSDMETLEHGYRQVMVELDAGHWTQSFDPSSLTTSSGGRVPLALAYVSWQAGRFLDNEPERSRRVARLAFANWRAWLERPDGARPRPAIKVLVRFHQMTQRLDFYAPGAEAPAAAQRMSPRQLAAWFETCRDGRFPLSYFWSTFLSTRIAERSLHRGLVVRLAEQLYLRERGTPPPSPEALVGPYLKRLPDDGSTDVDDGTTPSSKPD